MTIEDIWRTSAQIDVALGRLRALIQRPQAQLRLVGDDDVSNPDCETRHADVVQLSPAEVAS